MKPTSHQVQALVIFVINNIKTHLTITTMLIEVPKVIAISLMMTVSMVVKFLIQAALLLVLVLKAIMNSLPLLKLNMIYQVVMPVIPFLVYIQANRPKKAKCLLI